MYKKGTFYRSKHKPKVSLNYRNPRKPLSLILEQLGPISQPVLQLKGKKLEKM